MLCIGPFIALNQSLESLLATGASVRTATEPKNWRSIGKRIGPVGAITAARRRTICP